MLTGQLFMKQVEVKFHLFFFEEAKNYERFHPYRASDRGGYSITYYVPSSWGGQK